MIPNLILIKAPQLTCLHIHPFADQEDVKRFDAVSLDIFNLSDGDDEDEEDDLENSNSILSPDDDSKASVIHRIIEPGPSNQVALQSLTHNNYNNNNHKAGVAVTTLSTVNEKNHTEIEPGGRPGTTITVAEVASSDGSKFNDPINKLSRDRAPVNLGAIAKRPSAASLSTHRANLTTQATPTTLLDAVLIETSLCEPISPSFTINLPNVAVPMSPPSNFSISDNKYDTPQRRPTAQSSMSPASSSTASSFPFPPNFAIPGPSSNAYPLTSHQSQQSQQAKQATNNNHNNKFSFLGTSQPQQGSSLPATSSSSSGATELIELVLSPAKLGQ